MKRFKNLFSVVALIVAVTVIFSSVQVFAVAYDNYGGSETEHINASENSENKVTDTKSLASSSTASLSVVSQPKESLVCEDGVWYYTVDGEKVNATTLCYFSDTWFYIENGVINWDATTLFYLYDTWFYIENGVINWDAKTLCNYNDNWFYVENGSVNWNATTLCYFADTWFYIENGVLNWDATTLCYYIDRWFYVENGIVNWYVNTLCYFADTWFYVECGTVNWDATTLCFYNGNWFYVEKGTVNWGATTLCYFADTWFYIENGVLNWDANTLCYYADTWFYVENGMVNWEAITSCKYNGNWYNVVNGFVIFDFVSTPAPNAVNYLNVGSGYIAEIVQDTRAETFDANVWSGNSVDYSRPTNNYLPKGTVDYCAKENFKYTDETTYATLRSGRRVYTERKDKPYTEKKPVIAQYYGTLPNYNALNSTGFINNGTHTVIALDTWWNAPFYFDILPQSYTNPSAQDYTISEATYNYIDITFCYAAEFSGNVTVPNNNPLFYGSQLIFNRNADGTVRDITLRLFLRKRGGFYGWDSYYNEYGQLCFEFLNPKTVTYGNNEYGVNLNGAKILIDVGHGGYDPGASAVNNDRNHSEANQNLYLAYKIKAELEKAGAQVILTRYDDSTSSTDDKLRIMRAVKPDYCIAIHHNSNSSSSPNGFGAYYYYPFSKKASEFVLNQTKATNIYKNFIFDWHYYFMGRSTNCPVVLTENGYISNIYDYGNIINEEKNNLKAKAIARGIVDYFNSIQ